MKFSLIHYLCQAAEDAAPLAAQGAYSRADLVRSALRLSRFLQEKGIRAAALQFDDAVEFCTAFLACAHAGADIYLPPNTAPDNIRWAQNAAQIWLTDGRRALDGAYPVFRLPEAIGGAEAAAGACRDIAVFLKTSGTSGAPKTVRKTFYQMQAESEALAGLVQTSGSLKNAAETLTAAASAGPQHLYGLTFRIVLALTQGWKIWRDTLLYPEDLAAAARQCGKTVWITGPAVLHRLHGGLPWESLCAHLAGIFSAGGALSAQSGQILRGKGLFLCEIYGSSEAGVMAQRRQNGHWQWFDGVTAQNHGDGVQIVSPWSGGVQHNADIIENFADGFALLGRSDRIIKLEDKRIPLDDIEEQLRALPQVADACVARRAGYTHLGAWIAPSEAGMQILRNRGRAALAGCLKDALRAYADTLALPRFWRFAGKLPRNAQGKIADADIQAAFAALPEVPQWTRGADNDEGAMVFHGTVPPDLRYFGGHFAVFPIVPGVVELRWVLLDLAKANALIAPGQIMTRVENLKFQHFLRPGDEVHIALRWDGTRGKLHFSCRNQNAQCASGRAVFDNENG